MIACSTELSSIPLNLAILVTIKGSSVLTVKPKAGRGFNSQCSFRVQ
jgi:hypothetical protein